MTVKAWGRWAKELFTMYMSAHSFVDTMVELALQMEEDMAATKVPERVFEAFVRRANLHRLIMPDTMTMFTVYRKRRKL